MQRHERGSAHLAEFESGAPGSLGTYKPGIPRPPVGRTTAIRASRTAFGCSVLPSEETAWYPTAAEQSSVTCSPYGYCAIVMRRTIDAPIYFSPIAEVIRNR